MALVFCSVSLFTLLSLVGLSLRWSLRFFFCSQARVIVFVYDNSFVFFLLVIFVFWVSHGFVWIFIMRFHCHWFIEMFRITRARSTRIYSAYRGPTTTISDLRPKPILIVILYFSVALACEETKGELAKVLHTKQKTVLLLLLLS